MKKCTEKYWLTNVKSFCIISLLLYLHHQRVGFFFLLIQNRNKRRREKIKMSSIKARGTNLKTQKPKQQRRRSRWDTGGNVKMETEEHRPQGNTELQMQASESGFWPSSERFSHRHLWIYKMKFIVVVITSLQRRSTAELGADKQTQSVIPFA